MSTRVRSFSKINLGLAVGPTRADGFHALRTVYQTLALHDLVTVTARPADRTKMTLRANHPGVPRTEAGSAERNTAWKMVAGALERMRVTAEVEIFIDKRLPVQGGMGAGSANAVAALLGLERELGRKLPEEERMALAAAVGSDVPLFLLGGTVLGVGRGEEVYPLAEAEGAAGIACVVALPEVGVSTAAAFRELDLRQPSARGPKPPDVDEPMRPEAKASGYLEASGYARSPGSLTFQQGRDSLEELSRAYAAVWKTRGVEHGPSGIAFTNRPELDSGDLSKDRAPAEQEDVSGDLAENPLLALVRTGIENDFEEVVFSQHPSLRSIKRDLLGSSGEGALYAALSGSGSALFGLYRSQADARAAQYRVQQSGMRAILTETLSRRGYWDTMFAE